MCHHPGMRRLRTWAARLLLLVGSLLLSVVALELVARHRAGAPNAWMLINTPNWYDNAIFKPDVELYQVLQPGAVGRFETPEFSTRVRISPEGLRGDAVPPKAQGEKRILAIGDSFTLAVQVDEDETFHALLGEQVGARVFNAGVDGYGTGQATRYAARVADAVQPDLLLLTFFLGNDFADNRNFRPNGYGSTFPARPPILSRNDRIFGGFALYFHYRAWQLAKDPTKARSLQHMRGEVELFSQGMDLRNVLGPTQTALQELESFAARRGIPLVIAVAPPAFALDDAATVDALRMVGLTGRAADVRAPARALATVLPRSARTVDLREPLAAGNAEGRTYFIFDGHWTARGHRVVAQALAAPVAEALGRP